MLTVASLFALGSTLHLIASLVRPWPSSQPYYPTPTQRLERASWQELAEGFALMGNIAFTAGSFAFLGLQVSV